ncbi:AMP-binding protein [Salipiger sp. P9]|uniref:AMP-binding protein n=1 Tax=Salipiger pentaromativorans TaxID=2943193 RepID=UPI002157F260|nr:AMP-binding protein [Salipiger pentaromativorans]
MSGAAGHPASGPAAGSAYRRGYAAWQEDPEGFWRAAAQEISWVSPPARIFDPDSGAYGRWFPDATCNTCYNCIDRHVAAGQGARIALIYDSPITGRARRYSFAELQREVAALAQVMLDRGVAPGDRVLIYMPMVPEAVFAMLACARIGAVHAVVFGGFAAAELASRIDHAEPRLIVSASCGIEPGRVIAYKPLLDRATELSAHKPAARIVLQRPEQPCAMTEGLDVDYRQAVDAAMAADRLAGCRTVAATDPLYILYTSGTTGQPKGVVRENGGHMVALKWSMQNVYGMAPGEVFWAASDVGWVVGHSYIVYGPLLQGCATVLFEGKPVGTPDAGTFWRVISEHGVSALFAAPTAIRAIRREDPGGAFIGRWDLSCLRQMFVAGERADPETIIWAETGLNVPVIDHWWQTETGWAIAANPAGLGLLPVKYGSPGVAMPGYDIRVLDDEGAPLPPGALGNIAIRLPLPPSCFATLWTADQRFRDTYLSRFPGYYDTADAGYMDEDGYVFVMSRTDDVIQVAGHRLSTGALEDAVLGHPDLAECAVVGIGDALKGQVPFGIVVMKAGTARGEAEIAREVSQRVRETVGAIASLRGVLVVAGLPKTRSGKILRGVIRKILDGERWSYPATIEDPERLDAIAEAVAQMRAGSA